MSSPGVRRGRAPRIVIVSTASALVVVLGLLLGVGWYYSGELLDPAKAVPGYGDVSLGATAVNGVSAVSLQKGGDTANEGLWGLEWPGGFAHLGKVLSQDDTKVVRELVLGTAPPSDTKVRMTPAMWPSDPKAALGLDFQEVRVQSELGAMPAWYTPGSSTWVIAVHGHGGTRQETLRVIPALHQLGFGVLSVTYRNDAGAPASPDGLYHLGDSEWRDVEAAMRYGTEHGAKKFVLYGWSMGGAVVEQVLAQSALAGQVSAVVLDAPVVSWTKTLDLQAANRGLPLTGPLARLAELVSGWRTGTDFGRMELLDSPPAHRPPTLLFHGAADSTVPVRASRDLAAAASRLGWPLTYVEVPGAEHTAAWNVDRQSYERTMSEFLTKFAG
ncbi:hypothetical protein BC739_007071 [Kutzneria viridogrisea]|uniref:Peptidase S9 prolyl oligopeptidase catalytic domain-containing protein n=1 Tax=Kutzneria viridogrisea TaxID=47990 RepID=A0ABR6BSH5_9PSEU|nr:hypothetical protein [Kutzneria viridogrisea]